MVRVKPVDVARAHLEAAIAMIPGRYREAVRVAVWKEPAIAGEELWGAAVSAAAAERRRAKGIEKVTDDEWRRAADVKGGARIGPGITEGLPKYERNWAPYRAAIEAVEIAPKTIDPMANIDARVKPIVAALVAKKKEILGV